MEKVAEDTERPLYVRAAHGHRIIVRGEVLDVVEGEVEAEIHEHVETGAVPLQRPRHKYPHKRRADTARTDLSRGRAFSHAPRM